MKLVFSLAFCLVTFLFQACSQDVEQKQEKEKASVKEKKVTYKKDVLHNYGGWFCPDNLTGLPPTDIRFLNQLPVVKGRLPNKEETQNGSALIFIDTTAIPDAKPLDLDLPRLAKYYLRYSDKEELVIVFQAVTAGEDTVVGLRFPSGGNASGRLNEITFLEDEEIDQIAATQYVFIEKEMKTTKADIWEKVKKSSYGKMLAEKYLLASNMKMSWLQEAFIPIEYQSATEVANGTISDHFGSLYLQINYQKLGRDYVEKLLVLENEDGTAKVQWVAGPFGNEFETEKLKWKSFLTELEN